MTKQVTKLLTRQLRGMAPPLVEEEQRLRYLKGLIQKTCSFGIQYIFMPYPCINGYYDPTFSMVVLNRVKSRGEQLRDGIVALSRAMRIENSGGIYPLSRASWQAMDGTIQYFLEVVLKTERPTLPKRLELEEVILAYQLVTKCMGSRKGGYS